MVLCVVKVCRSGKAGELNTPDPLSCPAIWAEGVGAGGPQPAAPQAVHTGWGCRTEAGTDLVRPLCLLPMATASDHRSMPAARECHRPQARPRKGKWIRPNMCPCQESGGWRRSEDPGCSGSSFGGTRPKVPASLRRGSPHDWGPGMTSVLPVASAFPGRLTHPQIQPCCWPWQAQPLPLGGGLLQPPLSFTGVPVRRAGRVTTRCTKEETLVSEKPVLA